MKRVVVTGLLSLTAVVGMAAQQHPMRPGSWEVTGQMSMAGKQMPPITSTQCVTPEQLKQAQEGGPPAGVANGPQGSCTVSDQKITASSVTWKMTCTGQMAMTGEGQMQFRGDTYTGTMTMTMAQGAMAMNVSGKRVGDCQK